ncbi:hypothetical protein PP1_015755 [Pseudonocardia sp. P1]|nr:hypothetical protein Ae707Ps1_0151 [Pseudonocardia sp. Ae707_Ps1]
MSAGEDSSTGERIVLCESVDIEGTGDRAEKAAYREAEKVRTRLLADADELKVARTKATVGGLLERWMAQHEIDPTTRVSAEVGQLNSVVAAVGGVDEGGVAAGDLAGQPCLVGLAADPAGYAVEVPGDVRAGDGRVFLSGGGQGDPTVPRSAAASRRAGIGGGQVVDRAASVGGGPPNVDLIAGDPLQNGAQTDEIAPPLRDRRDVEPTARRGRRGPHTMTVARRCGHRA